MYKIGILWHIVTYIVGEMFFFFFLIMLCWPLSVSEPDRARKEGNSEFHQHQRLLPLSVHSTKATRAGQVSARL